MPKSPKWLAEYNKTIGGSRAAAIVGRDPFGNTPATVFDEMFGGKSREDIDGSPDIRRGVMLEPIARKLLGESLGLTVRQHPQTRFLYNESLPWAHTLPDGFAGEQPVELKVPRPQTWQKMYLGGVPEHYQIQCQHALAVTGAAVIHFAALCPVTMQILHVPIERNPSFIRDLMEAEREFYAHGLEGIRPADDAPPAVDELPATNGEIAIIRTAEAIRAARSYREAKALLDEAEEIVNAAKARLQEASAGAECYEVPNILRVYDRMQPGRKTFDSKAAIFAHPELARFEKQGRPFRTFRAYPLKEQS